MAKRRAERDGRESGQGGAGAERGSRKGGQRK